MVAVPWGHKKKKKKMTKRQRWRLKAAREAAGGVVGSEGEDGEMEVGEGKDEDEDRGGAEEMKVDGE